MKNLRTASLGGNFTGSCKKECTLLTHKNNVIVTIENYMFVVICWLGKRLEEKVEKWINTNK